MTDGPITYIRCSPGMLDYAREWFETNGYNFEAKDLANANIDFLRRHDHKVVWDSSVLCAISGKDAPGGLRHPWVHRAADGTERIEWGDVLA